VNRKLIGLVALLALVAACSSPSSAESAAANPSTAASAAASTAASTPEPAGSQAPDPGSDSDVASLLPDQVGGLSHGADINFADNAAFTGALAGSGVDAEDVEYLIRTWGAGEVTVSAMRVPGMSEVQLQTIAQAMAGAGQGSGSAETVDVGGKQVLRIASTDGADAAAYMYFAAGTWFTVISESEDLAAEVLSALP